MAKLVNAVKIDTLGEALKDLPRDSMIQIHSDKSKLVIISKKDMTDCCVTGKVVIKYRTFSFKNGQLRTHVK